MFDDRLPEATTGIRTGATLQNLLSALKVGVILAVAVLAFVAGGSVPSPPLPQTDVGGGLLLALGASLVPVFFTFGGYQLIMNVGADIRRPQRNLPLGVIGGVGLVFTVYMLINLAYIRVLGLEGVAASEKVAGDLAGALFGPWGDRALSAMVFLSVLGFMNVAFLHTPRKYLAMVRDGLLPPIFGRVNPRTQAQDFGLSFFAGTILVGLVFLGEFSKMLVFVMFIDILALAILASTLFVLRHRGDGDESGYRVPLYPWLPLAFLGVLVAVLVSVFVNDVFVYQRYHTLISLGILALGFPLSRLCQRLFGAVPVIDGSGGA